MKYDSINADDFADFVQELWTLGKPGDVIFLDSVRTHWSYKV